MRVLVTGGGGFVGSYVVERLLARGYEVRSFGRSSQPKLEEQGVRLAFVSEALALQEIDSCSTAGADNPVEERKPEVS